MILKKIKSDHSFLLKGEGAGARDLLKAKKLTTAYGRYHTEPRDRKAESPLTWILKSSQITRVIPNKFTTVKEQGNRL